MKYEFMRNKDTDLSDVAEAVRICAWGEVEDLLGAERIYGETKYTLSRDEIIEGALPHIPIGTHPEALNRALQEKGAEELLANITWINETTKRLNASSGGTTYAQISQSAIDKVKDFLDN